MGKQPKRLTYKIIPELYELQALLILRRKEAVTLGDAIDNAIIRSLGVLKGNN